VEGGFARIVKTKKEDGVFCAWLAVGSQLLDGGVSNLLCLSHTDTGLSLGDTLLSVLEDERL
jgi:hypothetical protein